MKWIETVIFFNTLHFAILEKNQTRAVEDIEFPGVLKKENVEIPGVN